MFKLRELSRSDIPEINLWRSDKELIDCLGAPFRFIDQEIDERWFDSYLNNRSSTIRCAIFDDTQPQELLGMVALTNIDWVLRTGVLHIMIGKSGNRNRGVGTFAVTEMLVHAFHDMNIHRVELEVLVSNARAIHLYEKLGFEKEGIKKQAAFKNGEYIDVICMAILREKWKSCAKR